MKGPQHFINHWMFFLFLFNTFFSFLSVCIPVLSLSSFPYLTLFFHPPTLSPSLQLFLVCFDLFFSLAAFQQVLTWLCSIEARVLSAWPLGPISTRQLVSAQQSTQASVTRQVRLCGKEVPLTSFRDVSVAEFTFYPHFHIFLYRSNGVTYHLKKSVFYFSLIQTYINICNLN